MMRELRELTDSEMKNTYHTVYREAFPAKELKPLFAIRRLARRGDYRTLGWFEDGTPLGYASLWRGEGAYLLLDYFAVPKEKRGAGIGAALLAALLDSHPADTVFLIESEAPDTAEDGMAERRMAFYRRCGALYTGYDSALFGVHYKIFTLSRAPVDGAMALARYDALYRRDFSARMFARAVRIPIAVPGEWRREGEEV